MSPKPALARSGFTLLELMVALSISAVLGALAMPSFTSLVMRQRLHAVAHNLQADIAQARFEAGRRGQPVHLVFQPGSTWCYALTTSATAAAADCRRASPAGDSGLIKVVRGPDYPGITLLDAAAMALDSGGGSRLQSGGQARFASTEGQQLQVRLGPMGRASLCAPAAPIAGMPPCPAAAPAS